MEIDVRGDVVSGMLANAVRGQLEEMIEAEIRKNTDVFISNAARQIAANLSVVLNTVRDPMTPEVRVILNIDGKQING